jgi:TRAP-type uncharacterized transport system substrate-binding protein
MAKIDRDALLNAIIAVPIRSKMHEDRSTFVYENIMKFIPNGVYSVSEEDYNLVVAAKAYCSMKSGDRIPIDTVVNSVKVLCTHYPELTKLIEEECTNK